MELCLLHLNFVLLIINTTFNDHRIMHYRIDFPIGQKLEDNSPTLDECFDYTHPHSEFCTFQYTKSYYETPDFRLKQRKQDILPVWHTTKRVNDVNMNFSFFFSTKANTNSRVMQQLSSPPYFPCAQQRTEAAGLSIY